MDFFNHMNPQLTTHNPQPTTFEPGTQNRYLKKNAPVPIPARGKLKTPGAGLPAPGVGNSVFIRSCAVDRRRDWLPGGGRYGIMEKFIQIHHSYRTCILFDQYLP
jgi:hypothetical protein